MAVDRLIPSVEDAAVDYADAERERSYWAAWCARERIEMARTGQLIKPCVDCLALAAHVEAAGVALDMALAQASDRRRAEADEIRRSVAWG